MDIPLLERVFRIPGRSTRAVIDLDAIGGNVAAAKKIVGPSVGVMAVVKANAYGHGATAVAREAVAAGADQLGVATVDEGVQLRNAGLKAPILVLGPVDDSEIDLAVGRSIELPVASIEFAAAVAEAAEQIGVSSPVPLHLKIDTGMRRFGVEPEGALAVAQFVRNRPELRLRGVFTHFARADEADERPTREQSDLLDAALHQLSAAGIVPEVVHAANSAGMLHSERFHRGAVRIGIALYGLRPGPDMPIAPGMRPAMTIVSRLRRITNLAQGDAVSYGGTYRAAREERVGLVPIGYADGYRRAFSNTGWMNAGGAACRVRGRVSMDQTVIALPGEAGHIEVGDPVVVAGAWPDASVPSFDDLAEWAGTINYEIATGVSSRVPRVYVRKAAVVAVEDLFGHRVLEVDRTSNA